MRCIYPYPPKLFPSAFGQLHICTSDSKITWKLREINAHQTQQARTMHITVYPKKYAHGYCFAVLCCGYTLTDFPISIRLTSLALWQSNDCPSASKATLMNMDKYFMWIHYERLHNHNNAKHNKTVCIFLGIYCMFGMHAANDTAQHPSIDIVDITAADALVSNCLNFLCWSIAWCNVPHQLLAK